MLNFVKLWRKIWNLIIALYEKSIEIKCSTKKNSQGGGVNLVQKIWHKMYLDHNQKIYKKKSNLELGFVVHVSGKK